MQTFKEAFDVLTEAYIKGEVNPFTDCACFVGNLLGKEAQWSHVRESWTRKDLVAHPDHVLYGYRAEDIAELEYIFMNTYIDNHPLGKDHHGKNLEERRIIYISIRKNLDEEALFIAFSTALDKLKEIHESKGEVIEPFEFTKRQLQTA